MYCDIGEAMEGMENKLVLVMYMFRGGVINFKGNINKSNRIFWNYLPKQYYTNRIGITLFDIQTSPLHLNNKCKWIRTALYHFLWEDSITRKMFWSALYISSPDIYKYLLRFIYWYKYLSKWLKHTINIKVYINRMQLHISYKHHYANNCLSYLVFIKHMDLITNLIKINSPSQLLYNTLICLLLSRIFIIHPKESLKC